MNSEMTWGATPRRFGAGLKLWAIGAAMVVATLGGVGAQARGHEGGHGGAGGMMMFGGSPERVGRGVDHFLDGLDASDPQRAQIKQIAQAAAADLKAQREAGRMLRERGMQLLAAPAVDANAAEVLRRQMLDQHDVASKRMLQAVLDVANVLTPDQRAKLAERMQKHRARMDERMRGTGR